MVCVEHPILLKFIANVERLATDLSPEERLARLWTKPESYQAHLRRRLHYGHINAPRELADHAFAALSCAAEARFSGEEFPVLEIGDRAWSIILDGDGRIKTAYPIEPGRPTFSDNQRRLGHQVDDIELSERILKTLARLFRSP